MRFALLATVLLAAPGCIAIPHRSVETAAPPLVGTLRQANGDVAADVPIVVSEAYQSHPCARPLARATTDSTGHFQLALSRIERHWALLFSPVEHFGNSYVVCAGESDTTLRRMYRGYVPLRETDGLRTLECVSVESYGRREPVCSDGTDGVIQRGGAWHTPQDSGSYRLIVARRGFRDVSVYLQWIRVSDGIEAVVHTAPLPLAPRFVDLQEAFLGWAPTGACVRVRSTGATAWHPRLTDLRLVLGAPGEMQQTVICATLS